MQYLFHSKIKNQKIKNKCVENDQINLAEKTRIFNWKIVKLKEKN